MNTGAVLLSSSIPVFRARHFSFLNRFPRRHKPAPKHNKADSGQGSFLPAVCQEWIGSRHISAVGSSLGREDHLQWSIAMIKKRTLSVGLFLLVFMSPFSTRAALLTHRYSFDADASDSVGGRPGSRAGPSHRSVLCAPSPPGAFEVFAAFGCGVTRRGQMTCGNG